jgi:hypothetical protein
MINHRRDEKADHPHQPMPLLSHQQPLLFNTKICFLVGVECLRQPSRFDRNTPGGLVGEKLQEKCQLIRGA